MGVTKEYLIIGSIVTVIASVEKYIPISRKRERWKSGGEPPGKILMNTLFKIKIHPLPDKKEQHLLFQSHLLVY